MKTGWLLATLLMTASETSNTAASIDEESDLPRSNDASQRHVGGTAMHADIIDPTAASMEASAADVDSAFPASIEGHWTVAAFGTSNDVKRARFAFPLSFWFEPPTEGVRILSMNMQVVANQSCVYQVENATLLPPSSRESNLCVSTMDGSLDEQQCGSIKDAVTCQAMAKRDQAFLDAFFLNGEPLRWRIIEDRLILESTARAAHVELERQPKLEKLR